MNLLGNRLLTELSWNEIISMGSNSMSLTPLQKWEIQVQRDKHRTSHEDESKMRMMIYKTKIAKNGQGSGPPPEDSKRPGRILLYSFWREYCSGRTLILDFSSSATKRLKFCCLTTQFLAPCLGKLRGRSKRIVRLLTFWQVAVEFPVRKVKEFKECLKNYKLN